MQPLENPTHVNLVLKGVLRVDKDVIHIGGVEIVKVLKEDVINVPLEASRSIT